MYYAIHNKNINAIFFTRHELRKTLELYDIDKHDYKSFDKIEEAVEYACDGVTKEIVGWDQFSTTTDDKIYIYADGSFRGKKAAYAVWLGQDHEHNHSAPVPTEKKTSQTAELHAMIYAIQLAYRQYPQKQVVICSDSEYVTGVVKNSGKWKANGWEHTGGAVKNLDLVKEIYKLTQDPKFKYIKIEHLYTKYGIHSHPPPSDKKSIGYEKWYAINEADKMARKHTEPIAKRIYRTKKRE